MKLVFGIKIRPEVLTKMITDRVTITGMQLEKLSIEDYGPDEFKVSYLNGFFDIISEKGRFELIEKLNSKGYRILSSG